MGKIKEKASRKMPFLFDSKWCLGRESNPHTPKDTGFSYHLRFSPPANAVCGLDFTFAFYYFHSIQAGTVKSLHFSEN